jgi:acyl-coenzyme A synthetase/AMP-(fatty) acid ligase
MVPERIDVLDELPRTSTGKVDRTRLARSAHGPRP